MSLELKWEVYGEEELRLGFSRFVDEIKDFGPAFEDIVRLLEQSIVPEIFAQEGARIGESWPALSPAYAAWKGKHYPGRPLLVRTGEMKSSLIGKTGHSIRRKTATSFEYGTNLPYGIFHQLGGQRIPRRKFLGLAADDRIAMGKIMHKYAVACLKGKPK